MNTKVEKIGTNKAKFVIEVDGKIFSVAEDKAFNKLKNKLNAPGFRKGKVTKEMAYKVYGRDAFLEETINECINNTYYDAIKESEEKVLSSPKINVVKAKIDEEPPFIYEAEVAIMPDVEIKEYKGVKISKTNIDVTDEEVDKKLKEEQEKNARLVSVDRKSKNGDVLNINFEGFVDGKAFKGGKAESYQLTLGSKSFIDNFEDQLIDKNVGDDVDVNVTFPENYGEKDLAGKKALFKVKVNEIKEKQLPDIDDEFVSEISEFETLVDYKNEIRKNIKEMKENSQKDVDKSKILNEIANNVKIDLAPEAIESQVDEMIYNYRNRLEYQGLKFEKYLEMIGKSIDDFRKEQMPIAEKNLKQSIILEKIAKIENIEASDKMVDDEIKKMAESYGMDVEQFKKSYANDDDKKRIKDDLLYPAVLDFLYENANIS